jgi:hypothetical protein
MAQRDRGEPGLDSNKREVFETKKKPLGDSGKRCLQQESDYLKGYPYFE